MFTDIKVPIISSLWKFFFSLCFDTQSVQRYWEVPIKCSLCDIFLHGASHFCELDDCTFQLNQFSAGKQISLYYNSKIYIIFLALDFCVFIRWTMSFSIYVEVLVRLIFSYVHNVQTILLNLQPCRQYQKNLSYGQNHLCRINTPLLMFIYSTRREIRHNLLHDNFYFIYLQFSTELIKIKSDLKNFIKPLTLCRNKFKRKMIK